MSRDSLAEKLATLAVEIVDAASDNPMREEIPLETKIDAFKAVSTYHVAYTRAKMRIPEKEPEDDSGVDFDAFRTAVNEAKTDSGGAGGTGSGAPARGK